MTNERSKSIEPFRLNIVGNKTTMFFKWNSLRFLESKIDNIFALGARLFLCEISLRDYTQIPDSTGVEDFLRSNEFAVLLDEKAVGETYDQGYQSEEDALKIVINYCQCDVAERASIMELFRCCMALTWLLDRCYGGKTTDEFTTTIFLYDTLVTGRSHEVIGYWTAKSVESRRNKSHGAAKMKEKGKTHEDTIRKLLAEMDIKSLRVFISNKKLGEKFLERAKKETNGLSPKRTMDIARKVLKENPTVLDTKSPV